MVNLTNWEEVEVGNNVVLKECQQLNGVWVYPKFGSDSLQNELSEVMDIIGDKFYYLSEIDGVDLKLNDLEEYKEFKDYILNKKAKVLPSHKTGVKK